MSVIDFSTRIANDMVGDDIVQPFQLEQSSLRGRLIRLGPVLDDILGRHDYPQVVSKLVAEAVTVSLALASMLKYDGVFTLQTSSKGPISMIVTDVTSQGAIRGCAKFDPDELATLGENPSFEDMLGEGHIAFTVDQGPHTERYQGIVSLEGGSLEASIAHYFAQSEQIGTGLRMAVGHQEGASDNWRAGAILLQHIPDEGGTENAAQTMDGRKKMADKEDSETMEEDWRRANYLLETCTPEEFLSPNLDGNDLLVRLFHEEGVRVYTPKAIYHECRCSEERTQRVLATLSQSDIEHIARDNKIEMSCEFCNRVFEFDVDRIETKNSDGDGHDEKTPD